MHDRVRVLVPVPQLTSQLHGLQSIHIPSTAEENRHGERNAMTIGVSFTNTSYKLYSRNNTLRCTLSSTNI